MIWLRRLRPGRARSGPRRSGGDSAPSGLTLGRLAIRFSLIGAELAPAFVAELLGMHANTRCAPSREIGLATPHGRGFDQFVRPPSSLGRLPPVCVVTTRNESGVRSHACLHAGDHRPAGPAGDWETVLVAKPLLYGSQPARGRRKEVGAMHLVDVEHDLDDAIVKEAHGQVANFCRCLRRRHTDIMTQAPKAPRLEQCLLRAPGRCPSRCPSVRIRSLSYASSPGECDRPAPEPQ